MPRKKQSTTSDKEFVFEDVDDAIRRFRMKRIVAKASIENAEAVVMETAVGNFVYRSEDGGAEPVYFWKTTLEDLTAEIPASTAVDRALLKKLGVYEDRVEEI